MHNKDLSPLPPKDEAKVSQFFTITSALILMSVGIAALTSLGDSTSAFLAAFLIASPDSTGFQDIANGELWRLITPALIHFGVMHLLFNMLWLWDLGNLIEKNRGHLFFGIFVLAVGISSNLAQFIFTGSQFFGGMSGVVYGLLSYVWVQGKQHPDSRLALDKQTSLMMLGWFILCWTGILGPIANWAHTFGLVAGLMIGFFHTPKNI